MTATKTTTTDVINLVLSAGETRRDVLIAAVEASGNDFKRTAITNQIALLVKQGKVIQSGKAGSRFSQTYSLPEGAPKAPASKSNAAATKGAQAVVSGEFVPEEDAPLTRNVTASDLAAPAVPVSSKRVAKPAAKKATKAAPAKKAAKTRDLFIERESDGEVLRSELVSRKQARTMARRLSLTENVILVQGEARQLYSKGGQA